MKLGRGNWTFVIVEIDIGHAFVASAQRCCLFRKWDEEVFGEAPIKEGAVFFCCDDGEEGAFADVGFGLFHGRDDVFSGAEIQKCVDLIAFFEAIWCGDHGDHSVFFASIDVNSVFVDFVDGKRICLVYLEHGVFPSGRLFSLL